MNTNTTLTLRCGFWELGQRLLKCSQFLQKQSSTKYIIKSAFSLDSGDTLVLHYVLITDN